MLYDCPHYSNYEWSLESDGASLIEGGQPRDQGYSKTEAYLKFNKVCFGVCYVNVIFCEMVRIVIKNISCLLSVVCCLLSDRMVTQLCPGLLW